MVDGAGAILRYVAPGLAGATMITALKNQCANTKRRWVVVNAAPGRINAGIIAVIKRKFITRDDARHHFKAYYNLISLYTQQLYIYKVISCHKFLHSYGDELIVCRRIRFLKLHHTVQAECLRFRNISRKYGMRTSQ